MRIRISLVVLLLSSFVFSFGQMQNVERYEGKSDTDFVSDPGFGYMKNMDSLLRVANKEADSLAHLKRRINLTEKEGSNSLLLRLFNNTVTKIFFWIFLVFFAWFILYKLFRFRPFAKTESDAELLDVAEAEQLKRSSWYQQEIIKAEHEKNFMLATRYRFVEVLAIMNEQHIIEFLPEKTNALYAAEIEDEELRNDFLKISQIYELVWYGRKNISEVQYESVKTIFEQVNVSA